MNLHNLPKIVKGSKKRVGRGLASGKGKTSGRGMNGQRARFQVQPGFEGGQTPLIKRLRQLRGRGFKGRPSFIEAVNLSQIEAMFNDGDIISLATLRKKGLVSKKAKGVKVLGRGKITKKISFEETIKFSAKAQEKISKKG